MVVMETFRARHGTKSGSWSANGHYPMGFRLCPEHVLWPAPLQI